MSKLIKATDTYIEELNSLLKNAHNLKEILGSDSGKDKQVSLLNFIKSNGNRTLTGGIESGSINTNIAKTLNISNVILDFIYETILVGQSKLLLGYDKRIGVSYQDKVVGITDFNDKEKFEFGITFLGFENKVIRLSIGNIDIEKNEFVVNDNYLYSLLNTKLLDSKAIKLLKGLAYSISNGLEKIEFDTNLDLLSNKKGSYTYSPVNYSVLNTDTFVSNIMFAFYGTPDEGVVYLNDEGNIFKKSVGNYNLHFVLEDDISGDDRSIVVSWEMDDYKETTIFDLLYNNKALYNLYING